MSHPLVQLDDLIHQRTRLGILTVLAEVSTSDFTLLRDTLELTDGNLSRHLTVLEEAGYVEIEKGYRGRRPLTTISATQTGRQAFADYVDGIQAVIDRTRLRSAQRERIDASASVTEHNEIAEVGQ